LWLGCLAVALLIGASGCIDIEEHITRNSEGQVCVFVKVGVAKGMIELAEQMGEDGENPLGDLDLGEEELVEDYPSGVQAKLSRIDNEYEVGFRIDLVYDDVDMNMASIEAPGEDLTFLPIEGEREVRIVFASTEEAGESSLPEDPFSSAVFSSFKYRLTIGRQFMSSLSRVVVSAGAIDYKPEFVSYPDMFLVEIPLSYLVGHGGNAELILYR
jgi:hypothetical protein